MEKTRRIALAGLYLSLMPAFSQSGQPAAPPFAVASVKPNLSAGHGFSVGTSHGRLTATNVAARDLVLKAFGVKEFQLAGVPGWLDTEKYDVMARMERDTIPDDKLWLSLQPLLADRFKLRYHRESKQLPVYALVIAKGGVKMKPHPGTDEGSVTGRVSGSKASLEAKKISLGGIADLLGNHVDRKVVDRTGLTGDYDFKLDWAQEHPGEVIPAIEESLGMAGPSIFTAVQEQLGLKLESSRGDVEIIVIDSIEKPSAN